MLSTTILLSAIVAIGALARPAPLSKRYQGVWIVSGRDGKCLAAAPKTGSGSDSPPSIVPGRHGPPCGISTKVAAASSCTGLHWLWTQVWTSYPGLYQQTWYLTDDDRIAITGGTECLDQGNNGAQTWTCTTGDDNQVWYVEGPYGTSPSPDATTTVDVVTSSFGPAPTTVVMSTSLIVSSTGPEPSSLIVSSSGPEPTTVVESSSGPETTTLVVSSSGPKVTTVAVSSSGPEPTTIVVSSSGPKITTLVVSSSGPEPTTVVVSSAGPA